MIKNMFYFIQLCKCHVTTKLYATLNSISRWIKNFRITNFEKKLNKKLLVF